MRRALTASLLVTPLLAATALLGPGCGSGLRQVRQGGAVQVHMLTQEYANVYVIQAGGHTVVIDAGLAESGPDYVAQLKELGVSKVDALLVTHGHADHAGGAQAIKAATGARVVAHRGDQPMITAGKMDALCPTGAIARHRLDTDQGATYTGYAADQWLDGPVELEALAGIPGKVVPLPGHTEGSLVVVVGQAAFVGDLLRGSIVGSGAELHFYMCDLADNRADIQWLLNAFPDVTTWYPGHFGPIERAEVEALVADWPAG
ncbi:MAG: MBL fold metallo-hydrolase [Myxococcales bacterium]|nr:MBL fold metallo-hydrolase [Myxococcales bacterium]